MYFKRANFMKWLIDSRYGVQCRILRGDFSFQASPLGMLVLFVLFVLVALLVKR
jgi:hypothetical protein